MPNQQDLFINSDTNALSIAKEASRSRTRTLKQASSVKDEAPPISSNTHSRIFQPVSEKNTLIKSPPDSTDRV